MGATMTTTSVAAPKVVHDVSDAASDRWSVRRTAAFVILVCGVFWLGVGALVVAAVRAL